MLHNFYSTKTINDLKAGCDKLIVSLCNPLVPHDHKAICELIRSCVISIDGVPRIRNPYQLTNEGMVNWINTYTGFANGVFVSDGQGGIWLQPRPVPPVMLDEKVSATPGDINPGYIFDKITDCKKLMYSTSVQLSGDTIYIYMDKPYNVFTSKTTDLIAGCPYGILRINGTGFSIDCNIPDWIALEGRVPPIEEDIELIDKIQQENSAKIKDLQNILKEKETEIKTMVNVIKHIPAPNCATGITTAEYTFPSGQLIGGKIDFPLSFLFQPGTGLGNHVEYGGAVTWDGLYSWRVEQTGIYLVTLTGGTSFAPIYDGGYPNPIKNIGLMLQAGNNFVTNGLEAGRSNMGLPVHYFGRDTEVTVPLGIVWAARGSCSYWVGTLSAGDKISGRIYAETDNNADWADYFAGLNLSAAKVTVGRAQYTTPAFTMSVVQLFKGGGDM